MQPSPGRDKILKHGRYQDLEKIIDMVTNLFAIMGVNFYISYIANLYIAPSKINRMPAAYAGLSKKKYISSWSLNSRIDRYLCTLK